MSGLGSRFVEALDGEWQVKLRAALLMIDWGEVSIGKVAFPDPRTAAVVYKLGADARVWVALLDIEGVANHYEPPTSIEHLAALMYEEVEEPSTAFTVQSPPIELDPPVPEDALWRGLTQSQIERTHAQRWRRPVPENDGRKRVYSGSYSPSGLAAEPPL